jgi:hypothetical protein
MAAVGEHVAQPGPPRADGLQHRRRAVTVLDAGRMHDEVDEKPVGALLAPGKRTVSTCLRMTGRATCWQHITAPLWYGKQIEKHLEITSGTALWRRRGTPPRPIRWALDRDPAGKRWSLARKRAVVMRMLRGEPVEQLSRALGVPVHKLERWRDKAEAALDGALKERESDTAAADLSAAMQRIGELTMENELLRARMARPSGPLARRRSR